MLIDAEEMADGATLTAEVCVVGSGPAGLTVAAELARAGIATVVLEQGGAGAIGGNAARWFIETAGGARNHVRLLPFVEEDFAAREGVLSEGWPIDARQLEPWFRRAGQAFGLSPAGFGAADWEEAGARRLPFAEDEIVTMAFQFGDGRIFHHRLRDELAASPHASIVYHAAARELATGGAAAVEAVEVATPTGRRLRVNAGHVVLAAGSLDNAHLLLLSDRERPGGLGNEHDLVGRFLMDHPLVDGGDLVPRSPHLADTMALYDLRSVRRQPVMGHLRIARAALDAHQLLQMSAMLFPREADHRTRYRLAPRQERARRAAFELRSSLRADGLLSLVKLPRMLLGADALMRLAWRDLRGRYPRLGCGGWSAMKRPSDVFSTFQVVHQVEQPPRWDNRVMLGSERDTFGRRVAEKRWSWHEADRAATLKAQDFYAGAIARSGLGDYRVLRDHDQPLAIAQSSAHAMGTTRMHTDPTKGVVDADCRMHTVPNLFIAGSSTFVTGSFANPTLTIIALALRIADTLEQALRHRRARPTGTARGISNTPSTTACKIPALS